MDYSYFSFLFLVTSKYASEIFIIIYLEMGNAIHRMNIHFTDSDWSNVLSVVNTDISGEGTVVIEAVRNGTEK